MEGGEEATNEKTRIYVGGLGGGVTEEDLRKTFSALGEVVAVDIVRTKDRSFAYLDFLPSSDKSLPKLFSTYNGCMWKGGKLRLEKAKEHYLLRLKREWQEESENARKASESSKSDSPKIHDIVERPKKPSPADKPQINIYFPKLGKVKSLAQVGIGKHKYSFQRLQVPTTPTHFCDCEEHSLDFPPPNKNKKQSSEIEIANYEINEQELDIMNSVMNKIFEKANPSKQVISKSGSVEEDNLSDEDGDNLIINVANRKGDDMDLLAEMRNMMANQEPVAKKPITLTKKSKSVPENSQTKSTALNKKRKSPHSEEIDLTPEPSKNSKIQSDKKQSENNSLRSLKSSWKDLVGQKRATSFNMSDFIATQKKQEELKGDNSVENKKIKPEDDKNEPAKINIPDNFEIDQKNDEPKSDNLENDQKEEETIPDNLENGQKENEPKPDFLENDKKENEPKPDFLENDKKENEPNADFLEIDQKEEETEPNNLEIDQKENEPEPKADFLEKDQVLEKPTAKNDKDMIKTARGEFWRHKSSWTQLISTSNHTSFSISQIVPDLSFEQKPNSQPENKNLDHQIPTKKEVALSSSLSSSALLPAVKKNNFAEKKRILSNLESDGSCSFMRTEDSMKEWKKTKLSSINKKKRVVNANDAA